MPVNKPFLGDAGSFSQSITFLERPRLHRLLENAANFPLIAVYAGSGYGKTRAVQSFLQKQDAPVTWMQITESDNVIKHFWEKYAKMISMIWPETGARLLEMGIPETDDGFAKYSTLRSDTLNNAGKCFFVYDDFHLLNNADLLRTFERILDGIPPNGTVIIISRTIPEINLTAMMLHERIFTIREDTLCFTEDEIAEYFNQLELSVTRQDIRDIYDDTRGWAFAINLIGRSLSKEKKYERYALEAMKENIFKLIETEISNSVPERLWHFLLRISLIDHLAASLIKILADDEALIKDLDLVNAYVRYDNNLGAYMIHILFLDYLRQRQNELSEAEKIDTYNKTGEWCEENSYNTDALAYYEKAGNFDAIIRIIYSYNIQMTQDIANLAMRIFNSVPDKVSSNNPLFPAIHIKTVLSLGKFSESAALAEKYTKEWENRPESPEKNRALAEIYGIVAVSKILTSPFTDVYDFDVYFAKQREYYDKNPYSQPDQTIRQSVGSYSLLVGSNRAEALEEFIEALTRAIENASEVYWSNLYGLDDLSRGELHYYRRELDDAEQYLQQALDKSRSTNQYSIQNRALLFLMLISFSHSDIAAANSKLKQIESLLDIKEFTTRYDSYDIALSHYYMMLGMPENIPDWLKADFSPYAHPAFLANYANRVKAYNCYQTKQYHTLLAFIDSVGDSDLLLIGKIMFKVLEALSLYQLKRRDEAITALTEAYALAAPNKIIIPFSQYAKDMRTLTAAALRDEKCTIPKPWLEDINRKASAFARRQTHMISEMKATGEEKDKTILTNRETEVLSALSEGLSRSEIASQLKISVNTVKMIVNSIYEKLSVTSLHDALRIAISRKLI